jgi:hypothetical protein
MNLVRYNETSLGKQHVLAHVRSDLHPTPSRALAHPRYTSEYGIDPGEPLLPCYTLGFPVQPLLCGAAISCSFSLT